VLAAPTLFALVWSNSEWNRTQR